MRENGKIEMNLRDMRGHLWDIVKVDNWECEKEKTLGGILGLKTVK